MGSGLYRMSRSSLEAPGGEGDSRQFVAEAKAWRWEMGGVGMCSFIKNMRQCVHGALCVHIHV